MNEPVLSKVPSRTEIRAELEAMVIGDLLGPAGGENEELTEATVRDRYIVGVLAPARSGEGRVESGEKNSSLATHHSPLDEEEDQDTPLIPDELAEGGSDSVDDGTTDKDVPVAAGHLPSSIGMTFCVDTDAEVIKVSASWGQYQREVREDRIDERTGKPTRVWQRYNRGGLKEIALQDGPLKAIAPDPQFGDIYLQGHIRKREAHWVVTLFLINAQEENKPKDEFHIFQPVVTVEAIDGKAIFCKRTTVGSADDPEEYLMAMLYRHHVEFAVGHGVSIHAEMSDEWRVKSGEQDTPPPSSLSTPPPLPTERSACKPLSFPATRCRAPTLPRSPA